MSLMDILLPQRPPVAKEARLISFGMRESVQSEHQKARDRERWRKWFRAKGRKR